MLVNTTLSNLSIYTKCMVNTTLSNISIIYYNIIVYTRAVNRQSSKGASHLSLFSRKCVRIKCKQRRVSAGHVEGGCFGGRVY